jgi:NAD(P)-dependent dehydrogenase (short-subunit alcohol dehydrogenase family)
MSTERFDDKVFIVTGEGRGLGQATAVELGCHGATVVINDLGVTLSGDDESTDSVETSVDSVEAAGGTSMAHLGDVSSFEYTADLIADTVEKYGHLDGIINYAGILRDSISYKMTPEDFDAVVRVHLRGHFCLLRNAAAHWCEEAKKTENDGLANQRSFVSVVSPAIWGNTGQLNYASAKAGILGTLLWRRLLVDHRTVSRMVFSASFPGFLRTPRRS